jgi:hypothetical protein
MLGASPATELCEACVNGLYDRSQLLHLPLRTFSQRVSLFVIQLVELEEF